MSVIQMAQGYAQTRVWTPQLGPQTAAYLSKADELLYGGQAGGGKTDLLLGLARMEHTRALIFRRTYPDVKRWLVKRSAEFYGDLNCYHTSDHVWNVEGHHVEFGHLESAKDLQDYQGVPYDLLGFDEVTQHPQINYVRMLHSARSTRPGQRVRVVATSNPGGEGHAWVFERWAPWLDIDHPLPARPGELRWYLRDERGEDREVPRGTPFAMSRTFIPAALTDNKFLGADYKARLMNLPEPFRSQLMNGDWRAGLGDDDYKICPRSWVRKAIERWRKWDAGGRMFRDPKTGELRKAKVLVISVDVGERGKDPTCFGYRYEGDMLGELEYFHDLNPMEVLAYLEAKLREHPDAMAIVDGLNMGSGIIARAAELDLPVLSFIASHGSDLWDRSGQLRFRNKRAEAWWAFREQIDPAFDPVVGIPPDDRLVGDLTTPRFEEQSGGVIQIQKKHGKGGLEELIGRSTDAGDVAVQAFCPDVTPSAVDISWRD